MKNLYIVFASEGWERGTVGIVGRFSSKEKADFVKESLQIIDDQYHYEVFSLDLDLDKIDLNYIADYGFSKDSIEKQIKELTKKL